jgi:hypothetical protein
MNLPSRKDHPWRSRSKHPHALGAHFAAFFIGDNVERNSLPLAQLVGVRNISHMDENISAAAIVRPNPSVPLIGFETYDNTLGH